MIRPSWLQVRRAFRSFVKKTAAVLKLYYKPAILAMQHPRLVIFSGAFLALALMSVLSALLGQIVPTLLPRQWTSTAAALLFWVFGGKMLAEGLAMEAGNGAIQEEMREVQKEIDDEERGDEDIMLEEGRSAAQSSNQQRNGHEPSFGPASRHTRSNSKLREHAPESLLSGLKNLFGLVLTPVLMQSFILTFLAEWGDRSQITTIALGAAHVGRLFRHIISCLFVLTHCRLTPRMSGSLVWGQSLGTRVVRVVPFSVADGLRAKSASSTVCCFLVMLHASELD